MSYAQDASKNPCRSHVKCPLLLSILSKTEMRRQIMAKLQDIKSIQNTMRSYRIVLRGQINRGGEVNRHIFTNFR
jgi:hypothetical protein